MSGNKQAQLAAFAKDLEHLDVLSVKSVAVPEPKENEVVARILLAPVNPTDVHQLQGLRPIGCKTFPQVLGTEGAEAAAGTSILRGNPRMCLAWSQCLSPPFVECRMRSNSRAPEHYSGAGVGEIVKCGSGVSNFKVGQRVVAVFWPGAFSGSGTWQQYLTAPTDALVGSLILWCEASHPTGAALQGQFMQGMHHLHA